MTTDNDSASSHCIATTNGSPESCGLTSSDYLLRRFLKSKVYANKPQTIPAVIESRWWQAVGRLWASRGKLQNAFLNHMPSIIFHTRIEDITEYNYNKQIKFWKKLVFSNSVQYTGHLYIYIYIRQTPLTTRCRFMVITAFASLPCVAVPFDVIYVDACVTTGWFITQYSLF